jgi:hypothetical protein
MTIIDTFPWKRNEIPPQTQSRNRLSRTFIDDENDQYITSDYYEGRGEEEERDDSSTPRCCDDDDVSDRVSFFTSLPLPPTSLSLSSMDFVAFDGVWNDDYDHDETKSQLSDDLPWQFIKSPFEESSKLEINTLYRRKFSKPNKKFTPKAKLVRIYDTEKESSSRLPLQNVTNVKTKKNNYRIVNGKKLKVQLQQINKDDHNDSISTIGIGKQFNQKPKRVSRQKPVNTKIIKLPWSTKHEQPSISTASTQSLSPAFSEDEEFWEEIATQSNHFKTIPKIAYTQRSDAADGSKVQSRKHTDMKKRLLKPNKVHLKTSQWTERNGRAYMEDRIIMDSLGNVPLPTYGFDMALLLRKLQRLKSNSSDDDETQYSPFKSPKSGPKLQRPLSIYATFDGHAGSLASQFCCDWFSYYLQNQPSYPCDLPLALRTTFHNIDEDFMKSGNTDGSTACVCCIIGGQKLICANAGDSRAIIVKRNGSFISLSRDHKPGSPREARRIQELGGRVISSNSGVWRVEG